MSQPNKAASGQRSTKPEAQSEHNEASLAIASLNATIKQLRAEGLKYEVDASVNGLRILIPGLTLTDTGGGKRRIAKVDASTAANPAPTKPQYEIRQVEAGPIGPGNKTMERLFAEGWELVQSVDMHGKSNGVPVWTHTIRREAVNP